MGFNVSVRTVQRDLKELSNIFKIDLNDKNSRDYGWRWGKEASFDIPNISIPEALTLQLAKMHLRPLLPAAMFSELNGIFVQAKNKLDKVVNYNYMD